MERTNRTFVEPKGGHVLEDHRGEKLHMVSLQEAELHGVDMRGASLAHVNWVGSKWQHIYFADVRIDMAQMGGTVFENIQRPDAERSSLDEEPGTDGWVNVEPVVFRTSDLRTALFDRCDLRDVDIRDCRIDGLRINGIDIGKLLERYTKSSMRVIDIRIEERPAFRAVGMPIRFTPSQESLTENAVVQLWKSFLRRMPEITGRVGANSYGLMYFEEGYRPGEPFDYMACVEVENTAHWPDDMTYWEVPPRTYAIVTARGTFDGQPQVYDHYWNEWMPASGLSPLSGYEFELYDHRFRGLHDPDSEMEFYFPVTRKG